MGAVSVTPLLAALSPTLTSSSGTPTATLLVADAKLIELAPCSCMLIMSGRLLAELETSLGRESLSLLRLCSADTRGSRSRFADIAPVDAGISRGPAIPAPVVVPITLALVVVLTLSLRGREASLARRSRTIRSNSLIRRRRESFSRLTVSSSER